MYKRKCFLLAVLFLLNTVLRAQVQISQPFVGLASYEAETAEVDSFSGFPTKIQYIARQVIRNSMTEFEKDIHFMGGQIIDLEKLFANDSTSQPDYRYPVPAYQLYFEWRDTTMGVESYCIEMNLDGYGQLLSIDWPRNEFARKQDFAKTDKVFSQALNYAKEKKYKTATCLYELKYELKYDKLCWHLSFYQKGGAKGKKYVREYKTIVVDAKTAVVLEEHSTSRVGTRD
jgi:hypothetical protein